MIQRSALFLFVMLLASLAGPKSVAQVEIKTGTIGVKKNAAVLQQTEGARFSIRNPGTSHEIPSKMTVRLSEENLVSSAETNAFGNVEIRCNCFMRDTVKLEISYGKNSPVIIESFSLELDNQQEFLLPLPDREPIRLRIKLNSFLVSADEW